MVSPPYVIYFSPFLCYNEHGREVNLVDDFAKKILKAMYKHSTVDDNDFTWAISEKFQTLFRFNSTIANFAREVEAPLEDVRKAVNYLEEEGYVEYLEVSGPGSRPARIGFRLTHKGKNWKSFHRQKILDYVANKWIDFLALIIALAAFIQSCIALVN